MTMIRVKDAEGNWFEMDEDDWFDEDEDVEPVDLNDMVAEIKALGVRCDRTWFNVADQKCQCDGRAIAEVVQRYGKVRAWCPKCSKDLGVLVQPHVLNAALVLVKEELPASGATYEVAEKAAQALARAEAPHHHVFVVGDTYSVVQEDGKVAELSPKALAIRLTEVAQWRNARGYANAPMTVVGAIMEAAADQSAVPKLERVVTVPVFLSDGRVLDVPGYDVQSKTYYAPTLDGIEVPHEVSEVDVKNAVQLLVDEYLGDVAFKSQADRANTVACMLLPFVRTLIGPTPLHVFDAPGPGHGKTMTLACALLPGCGLVTPTTWTMSSNEQEKKLFAALRKAPPAIFIDNVTGTVNSTTLETILTSTTGEYDGRVLGASSMEVVPVHQTWTMSTNNGRMGKSMQRRAVWVRIDAAVENPMMRKGPSEGVRWRHPDGMVEWGTENRAALVSACLVLCRRWFQCGMPGPTIPDDAVRGSYERWQHVIGGVLQCAGISGFCENAHERDMLNDEQSDLAVMLQALLDQFGEQRFTARDVFGAGIVQANGAQGVGVMLTNHVDEIAAGLVLRKHPTTRGGDSYSVEQVRSGNTYPS